MRTAPDPRWFNQQICAFVAYAASHSATILDQPRAASKPAFGSGTCVSIAGRLFVATAAHVIAGCIQSDLLVVAKGQHGKRVDLKVKGLGLEGGGSLDSVDIAWIEVEPTDEVNAILPERLLSGVRPPERCVAFVVGTPVHRARSTQEVETVRLPEVEVKITWNLQMLGWATNLIPDAEWPKDISPKYSARSHYLLEYGNVSDVDSGESLGLIEPQGLSGGGIWMLPIDASDGTLWVSNRAVLAGIQTGYIPESRVLCGNRIVPWIRLMAKDHPELASFMPHLE